MSQREEERTEWKLIPTKEPTALIHCLDLKPVTLNRVIIAHMLREMCNPPLLPHPDTKQAVGVGVSLRLLSTLT